MPLVEIRSILCPIQKLRRSNVIIFHVKMIYDIKCVNFYYLGDRSNINKEKKLWFFTSYLSQETT